jgi:hypothetical protein
MRRTKKSVGCITHLGNVRHFCVWRWQGTLRLQSAWRMKSGLKRQGSLEEVGKRRRFGSLSKAMIIWDVIKRLVSYQITVLK